MEFDFEKDLEKMIPKDSEENYFNEFGRDQKHRVVVCRHWLLGLCHNGSSCSYLHRLDKSKMPACKHGKLCKIKNCPLKHIGDEELEECVFYKQGFCCNGAKCGRKHVKRMPEDCPPEACFDSAAVYVQTQLGLKKSKTNQINDNFKVTLCTHWLLNGACPFNDECHFAHGEDEINEGYQANSEFLVDSDIYDPTANQLNLTMDLPFPSSARCSYFILQAPDLRSLSISRRRGVWSVSSKMAQELNAAFRSSDHVVLYLSVRPLRGIYGVVKMSSLIPPAMQMSPVTPEFPVQWLRTMRVSLRTVAQLKLGSTGMFVGRSSADGRFENKVGLDILLICFRKPAWDWSQELAAAESNIRLSEKAGSNFSSSNEYYPASGMPPVHLHPDVLFSQDWVDRAAAMPVDGKPGFRPFGQDSFAQGPPPPDFYTGNLPGFVFCAPPPVIEEMFAKMLMGLPAQMQDAVIHPNVPLFIFDTQARVLLGIFHADSPTTHNIDPTAFVNWSIVKPGSAPVSTLPVQLRFRVALESQPVPYSDLEFQAALGEHVKSIGGPLPALQTRNLANMLARRSHAAQSQRNVARGKPVMGAAGAMPYYKPPFRCVDTVRVDLPGSAFEVKKRLLGTNASTVMAIVDELGSKHNIRIRLRGIGSGYVEGPSGGELPEPLHFNISADSEQLLAAVKAKVQALIDRNRA